MSFPVYPAYRDSGIAWLGQIPAGWSVKPVRAIATCNDDVLDESTPPDADIEYVEISDVDPVLGITGRTDLIFSEAPSRARRRVRDGDVIVSTVRTYLRAIAPIVSPTANTVVSTGFAVMRPRAVHAGFLAHVFRAEFLISEIISRSVGVSYPAINASEITHIKVPLPPPAEQSAIAAFLDRETGKIDALVAEQERLIALLKEKRQAVISQAVTKGLDASAPMKDSGVAWLGQVPAHWEVKRVKHIARLESGHTPSKLFPEYWDDGDIEWVSLNDSKQLAADDYISDTAVKITALGMANSSARLLPAGAVVFTRDATIGLAAITTKAMAVSQHLIAWCPSSAVLGLYLLRVFNVMKPFLDSYTAGATIKTIGMPDVRKLMTPVPPIDEQKRIVEFIDAKSRETDTLTTEAQRAIALLRERRAALISAAVTGKIDVRGLAAATREDIAA